MGQIEELEKELGTLKYQVDQIQLSLTRATNVVENIKRNQMMLQQPIQQPVQQPVQQAMPQQPVQQPVVQPAVQPQVRQAQPVYRVVQPYVAQQPVSQPVQPVSQSVAPQQPVQQAMPQQQVQQPVQQPMPQQMATPYVAPKKNGSTESWIGKHLMGVLASVLIFIALILFASLIVPYLNDTVKIALMFTVSIGLTGFSYYEHTKRPKNTFFTALLACGLGCLYLSILVTRIYFKAINDLVMYIMLLAWGGIVLFMGKKESKLFQVIGNLGFIISAFLALKLDDEALILPMLIYLVIMGAAHQYIFWKNENQRFIQNAINLGIIFFFVVFVCDNFSVCAPLTIAAVILVAISAGYYLFNLFGNYILKGMGNQFLAFGSAVVLYCSYYLLGDCFNTADWFDLIVFFAIAAIGEIALLTKQNEEVPSISFVNAVWVIGWFIVAELVTYVKFNDFFDTGALFIALLPIGIYGAKKENEIFRSQAIIMAGVLSVLELLGDKSIMFCVAALAFAVVLFVYEGIIKNKAIVFKSLYYFYTQVSLIMLFSTIADSSELFTEDLTRMFIFIPVGLLNAAMIAIRLDKDSEGISNKSLYTALNAINALGILVGLFNIAIIDDALLNGFNVAFTVALACINLRRHFAGSSTEKLYAGIKFGIILLVSLISYNASGYVISVATLAFAILCIFIGFNKTYGAKELRIYGLVLSMICVVKFIMIDITYENTIGRALSFLISGILCFGISAIYNYFEKQDSNG